MRQIAIFFTLFWIVYFPTCIAYNDLPSFTYVDEVMTVILMGYTFLNKNNWSTNRRPWREYYIFLGILMFYTVYGLTIGRNPDGVWLDFIQEIRPYSVIYCTWILNPQFTEKQKRIMLITMIATLFSWIYIHPETVIGANAEFPVLGQLAICTGMSWYLFTEENQKNKFIALALVCTGLFAPKFKFIGEVVAFVTLLFYIKKQLDFKSPKTIWTITLLMAVVLLVTWERFDTYYVTGWNNDALARPMTYKTAWLILWDYFPFGSGMGSFACNGAWKHYSPLYPEYGLDHVWGLDRGGGFICDAYYPTLAQFGVVGVFFFCVFWKRRLIAFSQIESLKYYKVAMMSFFCLAMEQTADSSLLSGKGMGYCMLIALCLNANYNMEEEEDGDEDDDEECVTEERDIHQEKLAS